MVDVMADELAPLGLASVYVSPRADDASGLFVVAALIEAWHHGEPDVVATNIIQAASSASAWCRSEGGPAPTRIEVRTRRLATFRAKVVERILGGTDWQGFSRVVVIRHDVGFVGPPPWGSVLGPPPGSPVGAAWIPLPVHSRLVLRVETT